jgi:hypothetical protein
MSGIGVRRRRKNIESGEYAGVKDSAKDHGANRTYAGRMLRLTSLAPNIVAATCRATSRRISA